MRFDWGGTTVVELFSMKARRFRSSYYTQLKEVARSLLLLMVVVAVVSVMELLVLVSLLLLWY